MLGDGRSRTTTVTATVGAMAFRDDHSAELVTISGLSFDACQISSRATFAPGEQLRLHLHGQGWIEAEVQWCSGDRAGVVFITTPKV